MDNTMDSKFDSISWIRELVRVEEQMEETGVIDLGSASDKDRIFVTETLNYLGLLKSKLIEASVAFNELKSSAIGRMKIYGIAKTPADFMLFRNGYKMIFSMNAPGEILIRFNFLGNGAHIPTPLSSQAAGASSMIEEHVIRLKEGAFGETLWMYREQSVNMDFLVRYHVSLFVRESAK